MIFPTIFINHGGGPLPLLGKQPDLAQHMKEIVTDHLPSQGRPKSIIIFSAHWETDLPIQITSSSHPKMYYDYYGFPNESYEYEYNAPGSPDLASKIQGLLAENGIDSELNDERGFDHGVFVPLMLMYPEADIPVVCVSMHKSLDVELNMKIGYSLAPLRQDEEVLIIGSGYGFHNMKAFLDSSLETVEASIKFNEWLKETFLSLNNNDNAEECDGEVSGCCKNGLIEKLKKWESAPGARICHPREEHLLPLFIVAAAGTDGGINKRETKVKVIYDTTKLVQEKKGIGGQTLDLSKHAATAYSFW